MAPKIKEKTFFFGGRILI